MSRFDELCELYSIGREEWSSSRARCTEFVRDFVPPIEPYLESPPGTIWAVHPENEQDETRYPLNAPPMSYDEEAGAFKITVQQTVFQAGPDQMPQLKFRFSLFLRRGEQDGEFAVWAVGVERNVISVGNRHQYEAFYEKLFARMKEHLAARASAAVGRSARIGF